MKSLITISCCAVVLFCNASASAQARQYHFDNFDALNGVTVRETAAPEHLTVKRLLLAAARKSASNVNPAKSLLKKMIYVPHVVRTNASGKALFNFTTGDAKIDSYIVESGGRNGVDPALLYAIMHQESSFKPRALSNKGASGLMQLMPGTAVRFGVRDRFDSRQNVEGGARYMRFLLDYFDGDVSLALAGYNAGEGAVLRFGRRVPPFRETQDYVRRISTRYNLIRNPQTARVAPRATSAQLALAQVEPTIPPPTYERNVFAVKLADGKLRLITQ